MRILASFDKFRGSIEAETACRIVGEALRGLGHEVTERPLSDGGEGFAALLTHFSGGDFETIAAHAPHGESVAARIGRVPLSRLSAGARAFLSLPEGDGTLAVLDMASAGGLSLVPPHKRNPWRLSSFGTGELLRAAVERGAAAIVLGIGGSGTVDLGAGALEALGISYFDERGARVEGAVPEKWWRVASLSTGGVRLPPLFIAADVASPLCGENGAAALFAPQKGLPRAEIPAMDAALRRMAGLLARHFGAAGAVWERPHSGAAGGIALALELAFGAKTLPGFDVFSAWTGLEAEIAAADLVLTGEGSLDVGSLSGKGPVGVARRAAAAGKRAIFLCGRVDPEAARLLAAESPLLSALAITPQGMDAARAFAEAPQRLAEAASRLPEVRPRRNG